MLCYKKIIWTGYLLVLDCLFLCPLSQNHPLGNAGPWEITWFVLFPLVWHLHATERMFHSTVMTLEREKKSQMGQMQLKRYVQKEGQGQGGTL